MRHYCGLLLAAMVILAVGVAAAPAAVTAYWSFDTDFTSAYNSATMNGSAMGNVSITNTAGKFVAGGGALAVNDDAVDTQHCVLISNPIGSIHPNAPETIVVGGWYYRENIDSGVMDTNNYIWETGTEGVAATGNYAVSASVTSDNTRYYYRFSNDGTTATTVNDNSGPAITNGQWNHIVMVANQTTHRVKYYHNGVLRDIYICPELPLYPHEDFFIGSSRYNAQVGTPVQAGTRNWDGYIDEVFTANHEPTADVIAGLYNGTYTPATMPTDAVTVGGPTIVDTAWSLNNTVSSLDTPSAMAIHPTSGQMYFGQRTSTGTTGGIYRLETDGSKTLVAGSNYPHGLVFDAAGNFFFAEENSGNIFRNDEITPWVSDFMGDSVDDDPGAMAVVPATFNGGLGSLVLPGHVLVTDQGTSGIEQIYVFSTSTAESEFVLHADSDAADGVGSPLYFPSCIAVSDTQIFVGDRDGNKLYTVDPTNGALTELATSEAINAPIAIALDPLDGDLFVLCREGNRPQRLVEIDPVTGVVSTVIDELLRDYDSRLLFSADGTKLYLTEATAGNIYEFVRSIEPLPGDTDNDRDVDDDDAAKLASNWLQTGLTGGYNDGDFNADGTVDDRDAAILAAHWVRGTSGEQAVPEPSTLAALLGMGIALTVLTRRRRRSTEAQA